MSKVWFKAKTHGCGWVPATWQGWLIILIYVAVVVSGIGLLQPGFGPAAIVGYLVLVAMATVALLVICHKTGEELRWRWGGKEK